jgi:hypothetical protein
MPKLLKQLATVIAITISVKTNARFFIDSRTQIRGSIARMQNKGPDRQTVGAKFFERLGLSSKGHRAIYLSRGRLARHFIAYNQALIWGGRSKLENIDGR